MVETVLDRDQLPPCVALGFTLLGGVRDVLEREQEVVRAVVRMPIGSGSAPRSPSASPVSATIRDGTTWLILEADEDQQNMCIYF